MPTLETSVLSLGELQVSGKGAKQVPLFCQDGPLVYRPGHLNVQWQPKAFNDPEASRVAICFRSTPEVETYFSQLDEWVLKAMASTPRRYFGQDLTPDQIKERYNPAIKVSQKGYAHLRAKMNIAGRNAVRCWNEADRKARPLPDDWTMCEVQPCLEVKGLWVMNKDFGLLIEMTNALIGDTSSLCPF